MELGWLLAVQSYKLTHGGTVSVFDNRVLESATHLLNVSIVDAFCAIFCMSYHIPATIILAVLMANK
jgi:hypothetical protein